MTRHTSEEAEITKIRDVIDAVTRGVHDRSVAAVMGVSTAEFTHFSLAPPLKQPSSDRQGLQAWFSTWNGPIAIERTNLEIAVGGEVAFAHSLNRMRGVKAEGHQVDLWYRETLGFRRREGTWRLVHQHQSVPFAMDGTLRACVDLKP